MKKRLISTLLALCMVLALVPGTAWAANAVPTSGSCGTNATWSFNEGTGTLTISGKGAMTDYGEFTSPGWASHAQKIKKIVVAEGITHIGDSSFGGELAWRAMRNLTTVQLPSTLISIGECALAGSTQLTSIKLPSKLKTIENGAFWLSGLTTVVLPDSLTTIGTSAFSESKLVSITIGKNVSSIGEGPFDGCNNLVFFAVDTSNPYYTSENGILYNKTKTQLISYPHGSSMKHVVLPPTLRGDLELGRFWQAKALDSITFPAGVNVINEWVPPDVVLGQPGNYQKTITLNFDGPVPNTSKWEFLDGDYLLRKIVAKSIAVENPNPSTPQLDAPVIKFESTSNNYLYITEGTSFIAQWNAVENASIYAFTLKGTTDETYKISDRLITGTEIELPRDIPMGVYKLFVCAIDSKGNVSKKSNEIKLIVDRVPWTEETVREAFVNYALQFSGMKWGEVKNTLTHLVADNWCASFVSCVAQKFGLNDGRNVNGGIIPFNDGVKNLRDALVRAGGTPVTSPQIGDIVFMNPGSDPYGHVAIICNVYDNGEFNIVHGNWHNQGNYRNAWVCSPQGCLRRSPNDCKPKTYSISNSDSNAKVKVTEVVRPNWAIVDLNGITNTDGWKTIVQVHCPIEIEISLGNEQLSSAKHIYSTSFGSLVAESDGSFTAELDYSTDYMITVTGTDNGTMDFDIFYYDENSELVSTAKFNSVPVTTNGIVKTSPLIANTAMALYLYSRDELQEVWYTEANKEAFTKNEEFAEFLLDDSVADDIELPPTSVDYYIHTPATQNGTLTVTKHTAAPGDWVNVYATPDDGYRLDSLTVTDQRGWPVIVREMGENAFSFTMPAARVTVTPVFVKVEENDVYSTTIPGTIPNIEGSSPGYGSVIINPAAMNYSDVNAGDWFYEDVRFCHQRYLMNNTGEAEGKFEPNAPAVRAVLWAALSRMAGRNTITRGDNWYDRAMIWAKNKGITDGENPLDTITREQLVTMLWRYRGNKYVHVDHLSRFTDSDSVSWWAAEAVNWAVAEGIINGSNGSLDPQGNATRAEVAAILSRFCQFAG